MESLPGKENNDNLPPQVGDWVTVEGDEPERRRIAQQLKSRQPFVVADIKGDLVRLVSRRDYKPGMVLPTSIVGVLNNPIPVWGTSIKKLRVALKPGVVPESNE